MAHSLSAFIGTTNLKSVASIEMISGVSGKIRYDFSAEIWQYKAPGGWYFVSLPKSLANEIRENLKWMEEGWGRLRAMAKTGSSQWETAIWYDTKRSTYILPLKSEIRRKENLAASATIELSIWI